jgi:hypothetical protein
MSIKWKLSEIEVEVEDEDEVKTQWKEIAGCQPISPLTPGQHPKKSCRTTT